jgi:hypothetical protein
MRREKSCDSRRWPRRLEVSRESGQQSTRQVVRPQNDAWLLESTAIRRCSSHALTKNANVGRRRPMIKCAAWGE